MRLTGPMVMRAPTVPGSPPAAGGPSARGFHGASASPTPGVRRRTFVASVCRARHRRGVRPLAHRTSGAHGARSAAGQSVLPTGWRGDSSTEVRRPRRGRTHRLGLPACTRTNPGSMRRGASTHHGRPKEGSVRRERRWRRTTAWCPVRRRRDTTASVRPRLADRESRATRSCGAPSADPGARRPRTWSSVGAGDRPLRAASRSFTRWSYIGGLLSTGAIRPGARWNTSSGSSKTQLLALNSVTCGARRWAIAAPSRGEPRRGFTDEINEPTWHANNTSVVST